MLKVQGGEDSYDSLSLQVVFRKSDLYLVAVLWTMICNLGDPLSLRHPVRKYRKYYVRKHVRENATLVLDFLQYQLATLSTKKILISFIGNDYTVDSTMLPTI